MEGNVIHPPPYFDAAAYEASARLLQTLAPARLLTAHYDVIEGPAVAGFLEDTLEFIREARATVADVLALEGEVTLGRMLELTDPILGPFTSMPNELAGPLRAHLRELVAAGRAEESADGLSWKAVA
jgi:glyoxylase-like metal-dependent hydrolase (beta-lactamase superfamily II)